VPGKGDPAGLYRMFILAMTPFCCYEIPSIGFNALNNVPDFQEDTSNTAYFYWVYLHFWFLSSLYPFPNRPGIGFWGIQEKNNSPKVFILTMLTI
jgi:hypothetical protein